ncbi:hypothetical protein DFP72DRAFT_1043271 [Ephemerocybe angulata]|uniref:Uncharacterized protein n=1 Tax=Ephemerocybe angulata TaxID=980116 RepID=A0A8H6MAS2_9AGAR|nr:hypothetical protein DFP72DRAFT_1043271 [Tulosesus angulatus]
MIQKPNKSCTFSLVIETQHPVFTLHEFESNFLHSLTMQLSFVSVALALAAFATARSGHADLSLEARDYIDELTTREVLTELSTRELLDALSVRLNRRDSLYKLVEKCVYCNKKGVKSYELCGNSGARWEIGWAGPVHNAFNGSSSFGVL